MMYAKYSNQSDDVTSLATSSQGSSPKPARQIYYVQSPSRDSHEEDKSSSTASATAIATTQTTNTTPIGLWSPGSLSLLSFFNRQSAASRVSGPPQGYRRKRRDRERIRLLGGRRHVSEEEEGEKDVYVNWWSDEDGKELSGRCKFVLGIMVFVLVFSVACFIVWGAGRPYTAQVFLKDVKVNNLYVGEGTDERGVPTKIVTINCSVRMKVHNPATFYGIHVSHTLINLRYYHLTIASAQLEPYYQPRKSWKTLHINIEGNKIPLYGAGPAFILSDKAEPEAIIPMILDCQIKSEGAVVGNLVKIRNRHQLTCSFNISPYSYTTKFVKLAQNSCIYRDS